MATTASCANTATLAGSAFEIDLDANLVVNTSGCIDWLTGGAGTGLRTGVLSKQDKPSGATDDAFGQGTAENDANPTIVDGSIPPNKSDLKFFAVNTETQGTAKFLQLLWTRVNSPQGTTNMDFELNQKFCDPAATPTNCANNGSGVTPETPLRTTGDKLITYDLSNGGTVPTISIRTWTGTVWSGPTVISGGANAAALGSVNTSTIAASGADSVGTNPSGGLDPFTFGEASINFSAIFQGGGPCGRFGSAYLKSRSSDSFPAELKDFIAPERVNITNCTGITTTLSASSITVGGSAHDSATLTGATSNAGGTVTYTVYTDSACTAGARDAGTKTVTNGAVPDSNSLQFNTVGTFYWQAVYTGDLNNAPSTSACTSEQLVVAKASPSIATTLSSSSITVGDSAHDSATLSGATSDAGGTVTYTVYTDNACTAGARDAGTKTVTNGNVPDSNALAFNSAGTFYWQAVYSGDAKNNGATSACTSETLVVNKPHPSIATTLSSSSITVGDSAHDSATLSGATGDAGGTVTYTVYTDNACTAGARAAGTKDVTSGNVPDSNTLQFNSAGTFYWQAVYSGDANNEGATSACTSETLVVGKASPSIATTLSSSSITVGDSAHDSATLSGATGDAGGTVTYTVYTDSACSQGARGAGTKTVTSGNVPDSDTLQFNSAGTFYWQAVYSGDANNNGATSACTSEQLVVGKASPSIATTLSSSSITVGDSAHDSATLSGATGDAGGTVTYTVYTDNACSAGARDAGTKDVTNGIVPDSNSLQFNSAGTFYWQAVYSGDANNNGATSACTSEQLVVGKASPSIATTLSASSITVGDSAHDSATLSGATSDAGGTVTYTVYTDNACSLGARDAGTKDVTNGNVPDSDSLQFDSPGTFYWQAVYSGDANNNGATSACTSEQLVVGKAPSNIATAQRLFPQDSATVSASAGGAPTGTVTFQLYAPLDLTCSGFPVYTETVTLSGGEASTSNTVFSVVAGTSGTYRWIVDYSGDAKHDGSTSACGTEQFTATITEP